MENQPHPKIHSEYDRNFAFHPWNVMLMLFLFSITGLFLAISVAFVYTRVEKGMEPIQVPWLFGFNTLILLASSWVLERTKKAYQADSVDLFKKNLIAVIALSLFFLLMQMVAWNQLFSQDIFLSPANNGANYLYLLSGLHFAHLLIGLPFLGSFYQTSKNILKEPITVLVFFSDPDKKLKLRLLTIYWHFLDGLWIFLVIFLLVNFLVK